MITLDKFKPRPYQLPFFRAMEDTSGKYKNAIFIGPRRLGKDYMAWNYAIRWAFRKTTSILYLLPTYSQAKAVIWDAISNDGTRFLDLIPQQAVKSLNASEMKIVLRNNSQIQLRGADNFDRSIVGSNASLIIFSEYAMCDPRAYEFASPIVAANGGQMIFISTPRGRNHLYDLWQQAQRWPDWFCYRLTIDDTKHISGSALAKEREKHSEEFIQQEWYCSFDRGIEGSFYARYITAMTNDGRIGKVPYDPSLRVNTAWDLGQNDATVVIFFQITKNNLVHVIDCYENTNQPLAHYAKILQQKEYVYGKHWGPHDLAVHDYNTGMTRIEFARNLGINFETREIKNSVGSATPSVSIVDGIEKVWSSFNRIYIDQAKCSKLIKALEGYHRVWDSEKSKYREVPVHDWTSDYCDAFRYMCLVIDMHREGMTLEDVHRGYNEAMFANEVHHPFPFDNKNYNNHFRY